VAIFPRIFRSAPSSPSTPRPWGLNPHRDRLCLVQLSAGDGNAHLVQIPARCAEGAAKAPRLAALIADPKVLKLFHFGRFDIAVLEHSLGVRCEPVYCTKIAAKLVRTFTDRFGLKDLCRELLGVDLSKHQQTSDWGADNLTDEQLAYCRVRRSSSPCPEG
jgi:ribonuclease D